MAIILTLLATAAAAIVLFGLQTVIFLPLTIVYAAWKRSILSAFRDDAMPPISVIVPAFNEERTILASIESILASDYPSFEVVVVDDGSTDSTRDLLLPLAESGQIILVTKRNGGKGSALNAGLGAAANGIILFTDADSLFRPDTIRTMARWFSNPAIDAVCGNDTPLHPHNPLQHLLGVTTHIGTGFVRRALSTLNCMPIISGNLGAVRRTTLDRIGGFGEMWGEDLDLTFRLHRARARIVYDSDALVICDVPRTPGALWKQRVRWIRSYIMISRSHRDMMFLPRLYPFSWYLPVNAFNLIGIPLLQILLMLALPTLVASGTLHIDGMTDALMYLGFGTFAAVAAYSILLDRSPRHLIDLALYGWLIIPATFFYNAAVVYSIYCEVRGQAAFWEKIERGAAHRPAPRRFAIPRLAIGLGTPVFLLGLGSFLVLQQENRQSPPSVHHGRMTITVATHFDAWERPADAISSVLGQDRRNVVSVLAVGAGRPEWNFFAWKGHEASWSNDQRAAAGDLLEEAVHAARQSGRQVVSIIDVYGPTYLRTHPGQAARDVHGTPSTEQICFTDLVTGSYGRELIAMAAYLARSYAIEGISLTELQYTRYCYDSTCLRSYRETTGANDWPRTFLTGTIDRTSRSIGIWRSGLMATFLHELADSVHAYGKKLYVDVPVDFDNLADEGRSSGLYYPGLLGFADGLVVWDYFMLADRLPEASEEVARFFVEHYGAEKVIMSPGLWGKGRPLSPDELSRAIASSEAGGARYVWITPNHMLTTEHWNKLAGDICLPGPDPPTPPDQPAAGLQPSSRAILEASQRKE